MDGQINIYTVHPSSIRFFELSKQIYSEQSILPLITMSMTILKNAKVSLLKKKQLFHVQCFAFFASNVRTALKNHLDAVKVI